MGCAEAKIITSQGSSGNVRVIIMTGDVLGLRWIVQGLSELL